MDVHAPRCARVQPMRLMLKVSYGSGQAVDAVVQAAVGTFLLFYLTTVCGMSGSAAGMVFLLSLVIDGVLDPFIGRLSDRWRSRWGRRLPFMAMALPPMVISLGLIFSLPHGLGPASLFLYALGLNVVLRVSLSLFALPHSALTAELTSSYAERSVLSTYRSLFIVIGTAAVLLPAFTLIFGGQSGLQLRGAYPYLGAWTAILIAAFGASCLFGSARQVIRLPVPQDASQIAESGFFSEVIQLFRNPSFTPLFAGAVLGLVGQGLFNALNLHVYRYFWKLPNSLIQVPLLVVPVGLLLGTIVAGLLLKRFEKRDGVIGALLILGLYPSLIVLLALVGFLRPGSNISIYLVVFNGFLFGICGAICFICFYSMIADAVDEHDRLFGVRREALYAAALMVGAKAATGLGAFFAGLGLQLVGFSAADASSSDSIPAGTTAGLGLLWGLGTAVFMLSALPVLRRYHIDRAHHAEVLASLDWRRLEKARVSAMDHSAPTFTKRPSNGIAAKL